MKGPSYWIVLLYGSLFFILCANAQNYLAVNGTSLHLNGEKVFLSGVNQAWYNYGSDFGFNNYLKSKPHLISTLDAIHTNGGNSIRMWVHTEGQTTPVFNSSGHVTGPGPNTTRDLLDFVREAKRRNILVTLSLWNAAVLNGGHVKSVLQNLTALQSYIQNALIPMVEALKEENSMAIWEIMNEPEGSMEMGIENKTDPCYDTSTIHWWDFADWTKQDIPLRFFQRFIGLQANAIHNVDPKALVTVGSWTYRSVTNALDRRDFYSDKCLQHASGGVSGARLDLYQIHTYDTFFIYLPHDPFMINASEYNLDKPLIIGEFSQKKGGLMTIEEQFRWAYYHGYNGAWSWSAINSDDASDSLEVQEKGMRAIRDLNDQTNGGRVNITLKDVDRQSADKLLPLNDSNEEKLLGTAVDNKEVTDDFGNKSTNSRFNDRNGVGGQSNGAERRIGVYDRNIMKQSYWSVAAEFFHRLIARGLNFH